MQSFVHPLIRWKHELGRKKKSATSAHKFLYSYLILWISLRKSASLGRRSPDETQYETLTWAENVQRGCQRMCVCMPAQRAHCWMATCVSGGFRGHSPTITVGCVVTSCKIHCAQSRTWRMETKEWECTLNWKWWGRPAEVMQEPLALWTHINLL